MKKKGKSIFSFFVCFTMLLTTCITAAPISASAETTTKSFTRQDFINGEFENTGNELELSKKDGDNPAVTSTYATKFTYEADVNLEDGPSAALTFGVANKDNPSSGVWYAVNVNKTEGYSYSQNDNVTGVIRLFKVVPGQPLGINKAAPLTDAQKAKNTFHYKVTVDSNKNIKFYLDGNLVLMENDPTWTGGNLGILSFNTKASFSNVKFSDDAVDNDENGFLTNLTNIQGLGGGIWNKTNEGLYSQGRGDNFAISQTTGSDFTYESNVTLPSTGAASLVFRSNDNGSSSYVANVDKGAGMGKLFKFQNGSAQVFSEFKLATIKDTYNLKVKAIGSHIEYYIDGSLVASCDDSSFSSGKFGLLNYSGAEIYQNLNKTDINASTYPKLTNLQINGATLNPNFDEKVYTYSTGVTYTTDKISIKPTAANFSTINIRALDSKGTEIFNNTAENNAFTEIAIPTGINKVYVKVKDSDNNEMTYVLQVKRDKDPSSFYSEEYRPQYHYSAKENWVNDPNGMVYYEGEYHLFYQYYPDGKEWGPMHWGHAVSTDLVHWTELPIALYPDAIGTMFSGSAVVDENNTTGFFTNTPEKKGLVAIYTTDNNGVQQQNVAYSTDKGRTWTKYTGNPVIKTADDPLKDGAFRDPKVFWDKDAKKWMMVLAGGPLRFFSSSDLKTWKAEAMQPEIQTECPDIFQLKVEGTNESKWVLSEGGRYYRIGDFKEVNGKWTFVPESDRISMNFGKDSYAAQTYNNTPDGRTIMINWMNTWDNYCKALSAITDPYNGSFTLQHELKLKKNSDGQVRLVQEPIQEYNGLRLAPTVINNATVSGTGNVLQGVTGKQTEIDAEFTPGISTTDVGFKLRVGNNQETVVNYNIASKKVSVDRSKSGKIPTENGNRYYESDLFKAVETGDMSMTSDGKVKLRIFLDWSSIEVFGNDGEVTGASLIFPDDTSTGMETYSKGGDSKANITLYPINSIWKSGTTTLKVNATDASNSKKLLEGAEFKLYDTNGNAIGTSPIKTDSKGQATVKNLAPGQYVIKQTKAPKGYKLDETFSQQIDLTKGDQTIDVKVLKEKKDEKATYKVTFKDYNGTVISEQEVTEGKSVKAPKKPTREGYTFIGWDKTFNHVTGDTVVTATYKINSYTVTFKDYDGKTIGKPQSVNYGSAAKAPKDPTRKGYTFAGWNKAFDNIKGNVVIKATYKINSYTVVFKDYNGKVIGEPQTVDYGKSAKAPKKPKRDGYIFIGWNKDFHHVTGNLEVKATYYKINVWFGIFNGVIRGIDVRF
ncbi:GH32 C-terminal domain-containing protein [Clostridium sp.]|jgi:fructan beta-fructosidase|uniref:GH32 C-terminal domain-containing protein n=1 Tax=Clostridium sp. TaxID=1506 RepID=UPI00258F78CE|nr:GH32 C-terminal domain-containing protein [Clostridium sp.]MDF2505461.1 fructan beta-fructosidase [Clostridium sp.]